MPKSPMIRPLSREHSPVVPAGGSGRPWVFRLAIASSPWPPRPPRMDSLASWHCIGIRSASSMVVYIECKPIVATVKFNEPQASQRAGAARVLVAMRVWASGVVEAVHQVSRVIDRRHVSHLIPMPSPARCINNCQGDDRSSQHPHWSPSARARLVRTASTSSGPQRLTPTGVTGAPARASASDRRVLAAPGQGVIASAPPASCPQIAIAATPATESIGSDMVPSPSDDEWWPNRSRSGLVPPSAATPGPSHVRAAVPDRHRTFPTSGDLGRAHSSAPAAAKPRYVPLFIPYHRSRLRVSSRVNTRQVARILGITKARRRHNEEADVHADVGDNRRQVLRIRRRASA